MQWRHKVYCDIYTYTVFFHCGSEVHLWPTFITGRDLSDLMWPRMYRAATGTMGTVHVTLDTPTLRFATITMPLRAFPHPARNSRL